MVSCRSDGPQFRLLLVAPEELEMILHPMPMMDTGSKNGIEITLLMVKLGQLAILLDH